MARSRPFIFVLSLVLVLGVVGCDGGGDQVASTPSDEPASEIDVDSLATVELAVAAEGVQGEKADVSEQDVQSTDAVEFTLTVATFEDVQVEMADVGIFPGKILRAAQ